MSDKGCFSRVISTGDDLPRWHGPVVSLYHQPVKKQRTLFASGLLKLP